MLSGQSVALTPASVLQDKPLLHSLTISKAKTLILGSECAEPVADLAAALRKDDWKIWSLGGENRSDCSAHGSLDLCLRGCVVGRHSRVCSQPGR